MKGVFIFVAGLLFLGLSGAFGSTSENDPARTDLLISENTPPLIVTGKDRDYWAYRTLAETELPEVQRVTWPRNAIDYFVLRRLQDRNLQPNAEAGRRLLARRAYLSLIGLPPSPEEVAEFLKDDSPEAYGRMIDGLLESVHYGERWARHWMDIARFAESMGFETDFDRPYAYHYRDFLIKAFHQNMPYDQFVRWQIAGDQLKPEEPLALMATGFLGVGPLSTVITEKEFESSRYDELDDMVNTLGTALLGTTVGCARCHDHTYDPITTRDYYALVSHFTRTVRTYVDYDPGRADYEAAMAEFERRETELTRQLADYEESVLEEPFRQWLKAPLAMPSEPWIVLSPDTFTSREGAHMEKLWDDSVLIGSQHLDTDNENLFFECETSLLNLKGLRMETLTHPHLPKGGPGGDYEGGFTIDEISVQVRDLATESSKWKRVALESARATSQENDQSLGAGAAINGVTQGWSIGMDAFGKSQAIVIRFAKPIGFEGGTRIRIRVSSGLNIHQMVGRPRFSLTRNEHPLLAVSQGIPVLALQGLLKLRAEQNPEALSQAEGKALKKWYARGDPDWLNLRKEWINHQLSRPQSTATRIMVSSDTLPPVWHRSASKGFPSFFATTHYLESGDVGQKGGVAQPGFPKVLARDASLLADPEKPSSPARSSLARWITDVEGGAGSLLARVFVNRVWHYHFGRGLVETPSDFGRRGGNPSHPALLEWLAHDFVRHGWDVKRLQKLIVSSATFRQSSQFESGKSELDDENRFLWRYPPRRVEAEVIRDSLLQVSGLLDTTPFGRGTRDPEMLRRSVYFFIKRGALIPEMVLFDWPEHLVGIGRRATTTQAPQALQYLNSPRTRKYAEGLAERLASYGSFSDQIDQAYRYAFSRYPEAREKKLGIQFLKTQEASYQPRKEARKLALINYCQSLFSLNEFIYIR